jgi:hypothetical protein
MNYTCISFLYHFRTKNYNTKWYLLRAILYHKKAEQLKITIKLLLLLLLLLMS